ncbi:ankyrin repeat domain-containing protein [Helicobacter sp. 23-1048]
MSIVLNGDRKSKPPLFEAVKNGDKNMAAFLLKNGANINAANDSRKSVLMQSWDVEINEWLIKQGANVNLKDDEGNTALIRAVIDNCEDLSYHYYEEEGVENVGRYDIARLFIKKGANPNAQNNKGQSAIAIARKCKDSKMLQILNGKNLKYEFR